jgi:Lar family restriction alleviation protein
MITGATMPHHQENDTMAIDHDHRCLTCGQLLDHPTSRECRECWEARDAAESTDDTCPFCGFNGVSRAEKLDSDHYSVMCGGCDAYGPAGPTPADAIEAWSQRRNPNVEALLREAIEAPDLNAARHAARMAMTAVRR